MAEEWRPSVISLDFCADQFVLGLADPDQIVAVSKDAEKPFSYYRDKATGLRQVRASAEDVIALQPDLVIRSWGGDARALAFYERFGIEVHQIGYASDMAGVERETRAAALALGQVAHGEERIAAMPELASLSGQSALYLTPGGVTAGEATLIGAIMSRAGLENAAGPGSWQALPLESLVFHPPSLALSAFFGFDTDNADHWSLTHHPVMRRIMAEATTIGMDESRITCPTWLVGDEATALHQALEGQER
jgi:iron complex transport system substrate-binding protein